MYAAADGFMRDCGGSPGRGLHRKARQADEIVFDTRKSLAALFGIKDPSRIVFTTNCTESLNLAIKGILKPGDHAILTDLEHNAMARPLWKLRETLGVELSIVTTNEDGSLNPAVIRDAIQSNTRLICCIHANNVMGSIMPIAAVGEIAGAHRIALLVDAAQTAGVLPIDVEAMKIDLLAFTGHKGLLGPQGTGGLYVREGIELEPLKEGGTGIRSESVEHPNIFPEGYEAGTLNGPGLAGLGAGVQFILGKGIEEFRRHETSLNERFIDAVQGIKGIQLYGPKDATKKVGITLLNFASLDPGEVGQLLDRKFGIMVRTGLQCSALSHQKLKTEKKGAIRFSFGYFNTFDDVEYAIDALQQISKALYVVPTSSDFDKTNFLQASGER
ncbi:MAG: aminotransferase class V-fold PLP-dependent enzyme [Candidatus Obscuribacterales bacterium]|nr:aminotransferase class V-fold PLP-dependent enzyme [Candidatus Obscuribacterales bacterium]